MVIMDEEGCKIHASINNGLAANFVSKLEQGQCYCLSNSCVTERFGKHHVLGYAYAAWVKGQKEVVVLMLLTMDLDIQQNLAHLGAYDMLQELKAMFSKQAEQELLLP
ncbi:hypothetical protein Tco_0591918 [Tanacetum coccineum]